MKGIRGTVAKTGNACRLDSRQRAHVRNPASYPRKPQIARRRPGHNLSSCPTWSRKVLYSICTRGLSGTLLAEGCCGARHESKIDTWWTQDTVQCGAQDFSLRYSRRKSSRV